MKKPIHHHDYAIAELPQSLREALDSTSLPWLNSLAFCTGYSTEVAERVWLFVDDDRIVQAIFYRLTRKVGIFKVIEVIGFPNAYAQDINELLKMHRAQLAIVNHIENAVKPNQVWQPTHANVFCHTYISILQLPQSKEIYSGQLSKGRRNELTRLWRKANAHFENNLEIRYETKTDIKFEDVVQLECLNRKRRALKGKGVESIPQIQKRQQQRWALTQSRGSLLTFRHEGKIIAGLLAYLHGDEAFCIIIAHNTAYDTLSLGTLCVWKNIEYLIDKGIKQCNFQWGRQTYKTQFLALEYPWSVHLVSPYKWLAIVWKQQILFNQFRKQVWQFVKTKLGLQG